MAYSPDSFKSEDSTGITGFSGATVKGVPSSFEQLKKNKPPRHIAANEDNLNYFFFIIYISWFIF
ncbi:MULTISPECIES: hypothetical protein [unclassified Myroides]|uniref:hypothetical protein n=1 Tax=unclassified Myroides TaxID=2642485 RepID=UPI003100EEB0